MLLRLTGNIDRDPNRVWNSNRVHFWYVHRYSLDDSHVLYDGHVSDDGPRGNSNRKWNSNRQNFSHRKWDVLFDNVR